MCDRDFEANTSITVGKDVDTTEGKNIKTGDVTFKSGTTVSLTAPEILLDAGTTIEKGCVFKLSN